MPRRYGAGPKLVITPKSQTGMSPRNFWTSLNDFRRLFVNNTCWIRVARNH